MKMQSIKIEGNMHKILEDYGAHKHSNFNAGCVLVGLIAILTGIAADSTPLAIGGASAIGFASIGEIGTYMQAYFSAKLDYQANRKYTRSEE